MADSNTKPEGPADIGEPSDEGGKVMPDEDPRRRNMSGRFPGEANEAKPDEDEMSEDRAAGDVAKEKVVSPPLVAPSDTL